MLLDERQVLAMRHWMLVLSLHNITVVRHRESRVQFKLLGHASISLKIFDGQPCGMPFRLRANAPLESHCFL